jgi:hypothetical protein
MTHPKHGLALLQAPSPVPVRTPGRRPAQLDQREYRSRGRPRIPAIELDQPTQSRVTQEKLDEAITALINT